MPAKARLHAVDPDSPPPPAPKKLTITQAADAGGQRDLLVAMRARIAKTVEDEGCPPRDLASLTRRLQEINREIQSIDAAAKQEAREDATAGDEEWDSEAL